MQIKTFSARTTKEVLSQIKDALGSDAVILDTLEEDGVITITAASERGPDQQGHAASEQDELSAGDAPRAGYASAGFEPIGGRTARFQSPPVSSPPPRAASVYRALSEMEKDPGDEAVAEAALHFAAAQSRTRAKAHVPSSPPLADVPASNGVPPGWQQWHEEWNSIKSHIMALMKPALRLDLLSPRQRLAIEFLQREGVEDASVMHLFQKLQHDPSASILTPLAELMPVRTWDEESWPQRIQVIAGPFGAGKTSVAIRMALALRKTSPNCRICLVNADATRGNGRLLLRHYCDLSDMAYKEASTTLELVSSLNAALREGFERIIVDLPGLSRGRYLTTLLKDAGLEERTGEGPDDLAVHLTLPPHYGSLQLRGILERYRTPHSGSLVWTKLDEAEHYGQMVNVAVDTGLPVSALSFGPGLGNSLAPAKENMLWRLLFKRELPLGA